jgi:hypothetical protein
VVPARPPAWDRGRQHESCLQPAHTHGTYYERPQVRRLDPDFSALLRLDDLLHLYNLVLGLLFLFQKSRLILPHAASDFCPGAMAI